MVDDKNLRYQFLNAFDKAMNHLDESYPVLGQWTWVSLKHEGDRMVVFERGGLLFIFNFHALKSYTEYKIGVDIGGTYKIVLNSDDPEFMGHGRVLKSSTYTTTHGEWNGRKHHLFVYIPTRTAMVLALK